MADSIRTKRLKVPLDPPVQSGIKEFLLDVKVFLRCCRYLDSPQREEIEDKIVELLKRVRCWEVDEPGLKKLVEDHRALCERHESLAAEREKLKLDLEKQAAELDRAGEDGRRRAEDTALLKKSAAEQAEALRRNVEGRQQAEAQAKTLLEKAGRLEEQLKQAGVERERQLQEKADLEGRLQQAQRRSSELEKQTAEIGLRLDQGVEEQKKLLAGLDAEAEKSRHSAAEKDRQILQLKERLGGLDAEFHRLESALEKARHLEDALNQAGLENDGLRKEKSDLRKELAASRQQAADLLGKIEDLERRLDRELEDQKKLKAELEAQEEIHRLGTAGKEHQIAQLEARLEELENQARELAHAHRLLEARVDALRSENKALLDERTRLTEKTDTLELRCQDLDFKLGARERHIEDLRKEALAAERGHEAQAQQLKQKLADLTAREPNLDRERELKGIAERELAEQARAYAAEAAELRDKIADLEAQRTAATEAAEKNKEQAEGADDLTRVRRLIRELPDKESAEKLSTRCRRLEERGLDRLRLIELFCKPPAAKPSRFSLKQPLEAALKRVCAEAEARGVQVKSDYPDPVPDAEADPELLEEVFYQIASNGIESMSGGGSLNVSVAADAKNGASVVFADTGAGIPQASMASLSKPFFTTKPEGLGLGLAVSKKLLQAMGGTLSVLGGKPRGTRFCVRLPLK